MKTDYRKARFITSGILRSRMEKVAKFNFAIIVILICITPQARIGAFTLNMINLLREVRKKFFCRLSTLTGYLLACALFSK
jgi:hypothetical protein